MTSIAVCTPWLNCRELIPAYLDAIHFGQPDELIVFDNASAPPLTHDDFKSIVPDAPDAPMPAFRLIHSPVNAGFHRANNWCLRNTDCDAIVFLNNDIVMTDPGWLDAIRQELQPGVLVGASLRSDPHTYIDGIPHPYLDGWCLAGMTADLLALDGFDEEFEEPSYYGDNDLAVRARAHGFRLVAAQVGLRHLGQWTAQNHLRLKGRVDEVAARNRARYETRARDLAKVTA